MPAPSFHNLPEGTRKLILSHALFDDAPDESRFDDFSAPFHPDVALLTVSRCVHDEALPIIYHTLHLGGDASRALKYLAFVGSGRVRKFTRQLKINYQCQQVCRFRHGSVINWLPVFEFLWHNWASLERVYIDFQPCWDKEIYCFPHNKCELTWNEEEDQFWCGLKWLTMPQEIVFQDKVPEYFAHRHAKELGWKMSGEVFGNYLDTRNSHTHFRGKLVNPEYPGEYNWHLHIHDLINSNIDVADFVYNPDDQAWKNLQSSTTSLKEVEEAPHTQLAQMQAPARLHFLALPNEIRLKILEMACDEWIYKPHWPVEAHRWNAGEGLLFTCKQIRNETPSLFRRFRIYGGSPLDELKKLGSNIAHVRTLEIHFSCFCPPFCPNGDIEHIDTIASRCNAQTLPWEYSPDAYSSQSRIVQLYLHMWTEAMKTIQAQPRIEHIEVTFSSCCRYFTSPEDRWERAMYTVPEDCMTLENRFLLLLNMCRQIKSFSFVGDVPPSLAFRVAELGPKEALVLKWVSQEMASFIEQIERDRTEWEGSVPSFRGHQEMDEKPRQKGPAYPRTEYPTKNPVTHFVVVMDRTNKASRAVLDEPQDEVYLPEPTMKLVTHPLSERGWREVRELMDFERLDQRYL